MNLTEKQWEWIRWFAVVALIAVFGFLGIQAPIAVPVTPQADDFNVLGLQPIKHTNPETFSQSVTFSGAVAATVIKVNSTPVFWATPIPTYAYSAPTAVNTATPIPTATALPFVIRGGTEATYTSNAAITHGFAAAPTWCSIFPNQSITATLSITTTTFSSDMASTSSPIYWQCGKAP